VSLELDRVSRNKLGCTGKLWYIFYKIIYHVLQAFAFTSMSVVIISTITFILSTMPQLATDLDLILFDNKTGGEAALPVERWQQVRRLKRFLWFDFIRI
jgi:hypothetical protein